MRKTGHLTYEECIARYPRLTRCMQWVAILSEGEAGAAIRDMRSRELYGWNPEEVWGGEAVAHCGGALRCIRRAIELRHIVRNVVDRQWHHGRFRRPYAYLEKD